VVAAPVLSDIFDYVADFDPAAALDEFLRGVPAKWVVYLLADADDQPVQLLCVRNLRASLKRRLGGEEDGAGPSRRVDYRQLVRRIHWRRVDSAFEADAVYLEAARALFPQTYQGMVGFRPAWFVHVDPAAAFPRYVKTVDLTRSAGVFVGPVEDKHAAARLIELAEDSFDLCRYYNVLVEAPRAKACAYKEMGKCPAPCDGSIPMDRYREMIATSATALVDPAPAVREQTARMQRAAAELKFEQAARVKRVVDQLGQLGKGPFRHARRLEDFAYLSLQRGPRQGTAKVFLVTPGRIEEVAGLVNEPVEPGDLLRHVLGLATARREAAVDPVGAERIGVVAHHLFLAKQSHGVFLPLGEADEKQLPRAYRELQKQKVAEETEGEGVTRELQAM
jgi:excinuclease UvrABC nuclease subunit